MLPVTSKLQTSVAHMAVITVEGSIRIIFMNVWRLVARDKDDVARTLFYKDNSSSIVF